MVDSVVQSCLAIFGLIVRLEGTEFAFLQPAESEDNVGAEIRLDILWGEFSNLGTVLGPVGVIADNLVGENNNEYFSVEFTLKVRNTFSRRVSLYIIRCYMVFFGQVPSWKMVFIQLWPAAC